MFTVSPIAKLKACFFFFLGFEAQFSTNSLYGSEPEHIMVKGNVPGPGTYAPVIEINKIGKYHLSTTPYVRTFHS